MRRIARFVIAAALASAVPATSFAVPLFEDNFDVDHTANWTVNSAAGGNNPTDFYFDYSTVGIPSAPGSAGTTRGLKLQANVDSGVFSGVSVSPTGQSFTGDYTLEFDVWQNYNGPLDGGGSGSTQVTGAGIGTAGTSPQWAGGAHDAVHFGTTGDGGSSVDYRAYPAAIVAAADSGVYAADFNISDPRNHTHPYYAGFGGHAAPAAQLAAYAGQTGETAVGSQGFAWHHVAIARSGDNVTYTIDDTLIATVDISSITLGGDNILLNHFDINASSSADPLAPTLLFGLVDNVQVNVIPEPGALSLLLLGGLSLTRRRRR